MKNYLIIFLLIFNFEACSNNHDTEHSKNATPTEKSSINKLLKISNNNIQEIYTNYDEAFKMAKTKNKPVFILFSTHYCRWCTKLKESTLKNVSIVEQLNNNFVVLFLDRDQDTYPSKFKVKGVPNIYLTDKNEEVFTSIVGYHKNPKDYLKWFEYIKVELKN